MTALESLGGDTGLQTTTSRRAVLAALTAAPLAVPAEAVATRWGGSIAFPFMEAGNEPIPIHRSAEGRSLSRARYHNAESFFLGIRDDGTHRPTDTLYQTGIVLQLALSSHLLDIGFDDRWCARHIGLHIARSFAYANATGLGFHSADMDLLAAILSPYGKWRHAGPRDLAPDFPFTMHEIRALTRALLDCVHEVTGHPRPCGWRHRFA